MDGALFPDASDNLAHRQSQDHSKTKNPVAECSPSDIKNPDDLCDYIMQIARSKYQQGSADFKFTIEIPCSNLVGWAQKTKIASAKMDQIDKKLVRRALVNVEILLIRHRIKTNVRYKVVGNNSHKNCISLTIYFAVWGPR